MFNAISLLWAFMSDLIVALTESKHSIENIVSTMNNITLTANMHSEVLINETAVDLRKSYKALGIPMPNLPAIETDAPSKAKRKALPKK